MHRKGRLTLTLILPDGTKSLIPADWTDLAPTGPPRGVIGAKQIATRDSLEALIHASALVDALLGRLAETQSEEADSAAEKEGILAEPSESLRRSAQRSLCMGNPGERTQDSRDRNPCTTHRPGGGTSPQPGGKS